MQSAFRLVSEGYLLFVLVYFTDNNNDILR